MLQFRKFIYAFGKSRHHAIQILPDIAFQKTNDLYSQLLQRPLPGRIVHQEPFIIVTAPINFNGQSQFVAIEVHDIVRDGNLPVKFPLHLSRAQFLPQKHLSEDPVFAQVSCELAKTGVI
jgi:hypothetical protein